MTTTQIEARAKAAGYTITGVLLLAGVNRTTWWRWKTGKFLPRAASIKCILHVLNELKRP